MDTEGSAGRSRLVAPGALEADLTAGRPDRIALDVFETEPLTDPSDQIVSHPRVIATPLIGDGKPIHMINPEARSD